jgi:DNA-binding transcriptional LysR family regulator
MQFSLKDLELFVAVAEAGSIARAADRRHTVASAASKRISDLEDALQTPLVVRGSKGVALTPAGHALLGRARGVLNQATQLEDELKAFSSGVRGHVRVYANISAIVEFLPAALAGFLALHKDIQVHLEEHVSGKVAQAVAERLADIGIVSDIPILDGLTLIPFRDDELVLVVQPEHPLAGQKAVHFAAALDFDFVGLHSDSSLHYRLLREASECGRALRIRIQVTSFDAVCAMVAAGLGVGVVPQAAATPYTQSLGLVAVRLKNGWARRKLYVCVRAGGEPSAAAAKLIEHLTGPTTAPKPRHRRSR